MINLPYYSPIIPSSCPAELYENFRQNFQRIHTTEGLIDCALDASRISFDDVNRSKITSRLSEIIADIQNASQQREPQALIARMHEILFDREGFHGCSDKHYYFPINSYLNYVLEFKRGLPILLSLIYKVVAEKLGLRVEGIHTPGRFLVRIFDGQTWMVVDPFEKGRVLSPMEVNQLLSEVNGSTTNFAPDNLPIATHRQWIERILTNLARSFDLCGAVKDRDAVLELLLLVKSS
jgi:regulator of sirC expression with transglutaminase-like and TPR domain